MRPVLLLPLLLSCYGAPDEADLAGTRGRRVEVYFNDPGSRLDNVWRPDALRVMVELIDEASVTLDFAVMGFSHRDVIDAVERAFDRGVQVRMVGDAGHITNAGYDRLYERHIPITLGNSPHIMHNKFMVVDGRFVFGGTANWSPSDLENNSNNFFFLDSPPVAADFTAEFEQLFAGRFGNQKEELDNGRVYQIGDTSVEVWFSPNEDAMGRILELVDAAEHSVRFTIFAFTKDQVGSAFVRKMEDWAAQDAAEGIPADAPLGVRRGIAGVIDQSQLHSNGQYHEIFRLIGGDVDLRLDAIDSTLQPGDYQAGGGRLHSKTMMIDLEGEDPVVITGSFNWSASATQSNDEYLLVFRGKRVAEQFAKYFDELWVDARPLGEDRVGENGLQPGDVLFNEIMWYGVTPQDPEGFDEFIELRNRTNRDISLDLWQVAGPLDFVVGFPPGSVVPAGGTFLILDHTLEPYIDGRPQDEPTGYQNGDMVLNPFNDNRQARLYLKDGTFELTLRDPNNVVVDQAGDGGPAFAGGPTDDGRSRSMERRAEPGDGTRPEDWYASTVEEGGVNVTEAYRALLLATPGEVNSPEP